MKDFKGTPGPWTLAKFKTKVFCRPEQKWMPIQPIALVEEVPMNRAEREANAKAIAAVPDMIEALRELLRFEHVMTEAADLLQYSDNYLKAIEGAKAALAKALD